MRASTLRRCGSGMSPTEPMQGPVRSSCAAPSEPAAPSAPATESFSNTPNTCGSQATASMNARESSSVRCTGQPASAPTSGSEQ